jgi:hypothetical protein
MKPENMKTKNRINASDSKDMFLRDYLLRNWKVDGSDTR